MTHSNINALEPKIVHDLYNWLPSYGESKVVCHYDNRILNVDIFYEVDNSDELLKKTLVFTNVCFHLFSACPGVDLLNINYQGHKLPLGSLIEFEKSEASKKWNEHFEWAKTSYRHFKLFFIAENYRLEVFAQQFDLKQ